SDLLLHEKLSASNTLATAFIENTKYISEFYPSQPLTKSLILSNTSSQSPGGERRDKSFERAKR
ncbi:unnamed protein product, partial [Prunus brigantina]